MNFDQQGVLRRISSGAAWCFYHLPRPFGRKERIDMPQFNSSKRGYRAERIERTVAETLQFDLLPTLDDPVLKNLHVLRVEVGRNLSSVHVIVARSADFEQSDVVASEDEVQAALEHAQGFLRSELASVLRIKRMPLLRLRFLPIVIDPHLHPDDAENGGRA
jgi:ribosome-binding factor A